MSGNRVENRDRYRSKRNRDDEDCRERNRGRQDDRHRSDKRDRSSPPPRRRERSRSRSRQRDDDNNTRYNNRQSNNRRNKSNYSRKFQFNDNNINREASPEWGQSSNNKKIKGEENNEKTDKDKPNFGLSGKLTEDTNTVNGVVIKYSEPQDSRKPKRRWRLYPFKGEKALPTLYVHRQSAYLMGRDRKIADIPLDHPSCSKQHAALQYRLVPFKRDNGGEGKRVRPYIIDLESANGTFVNNVKLEAKRFHELLEKDVVKFGFSSREYVLLHEHSKDDELDDDVDLPTETVKVILFYFNYYLILFNFFFYSTFICSRKKHDFY